MRHKEKDYFERMTNYVPMTDKAFETQVLSEIKPHKLKAPLDRVYNVFRELHVFHSVYDLSRVDQLTESLKKQLTMDDILNETTRFIYN